jgi:hypothetical protein
MAEFGSPGIHDSIAHVLYIKQGEQEAGSSPCLFYNLTIQRIHYTWSCELHPLLIYYSHQVPNCDENLFQLMFCGRKR